MFERRLKIFLSVLFIVTLVLLGRAMHLQVLAREQYRDMAIDVMKRSRMFETTRGRILDHLGRPIAIDKPCIDACVDYRAIPPTPDAAWVRSVSISRLRNRLDYRRATPADRRKLIEHECRLVELDISKMWAHLAVVSGKTQEEIDDIRQQIMRKVQMRRRYVWYHRYEAARRGHETREPSPWYQRWLIADDDAPELDQFAVEVAEQFEAHVILRAISQDVHIELGKNLGKYPGLELRQSTHRYYPYGATAAHLLGRLGRVTREDLEKDPHVGDELRAYQPNDLIGRSGLESLCERLLRGRRGREERAVGENTRVLQTREPVPGIDVECTIDIELQRDIEKLFESVELRGGPPGADWTDSLRMPGAAVVIDVATGEVRALVSFPTYDLNEFDDLYEQLSRDDIERPLVNRATLFQLEPGSTVKTIVGLGAITDGIIQAADRIECTGYLRIGNRILKDTARCWVASSFHEALGGAVAHHPIPWNAPHPTGFLDFSDAIERSCNIYFETLGDRMEVDGLARWFSRFGLGRPTGIGLPEAEGLLPNELPPSARRPSSAWFSAIGQDQVLATPIQMANVAATIARDGVWMRPRLVPAGTEITPPSLPATNPSSAPRAMPDRVDLKLNREALRLLKQGMVRAVNSAAGTGQSARRSDMTVAGKTGSAQAPLLTLPMRDQSGQIIKDGNGRPIRYTLEPIGTHAAPNPVAPWYRATGTRENGRAHAWFMGYAPAERPQVAFVVVVEYGGSGGTASGGIAARMLELCVEHGHLIADKRTVQTP